VNGAALAPATCSAEAIVEVARITHGDGINGKPSEHQCRSGLPGTIFACYKVDAAFQCDGRREHPKCTTSRKISRWQTVP
jgi:hypothetical protein